jgi:hypothetical protein
MIHQRLMTGADVYHGFASFNVMAWVAGSGMVGIVCS